MKELTGTNSVAIIILNYKTPDLVIECLQSIEEVLENNYYVVVVDNDSCDGSTDIISKAISSNGWIDSVECVESGVNGGFSFGNNFGVLRVNAEYYLLLNSDTLIIDDAINKLLDFASNNPSVGIVSPSLVWPNGELQTSAFNNIHPLSEFLRAANTGFISSILKRFNVPIKPSITTAYPDWVCFACVLVKREVFQSIGYLDEDYFMYFEDVDFCRRAREKGYDIANYPSPRVVHLNGGSSGINSGGISNVTTLPEYYYVSRARYFNKFYGKGGLVLSNVLWSLGRCISISIEFLLRRPQCVPKNEFIKIWNHMQPYNHNEYK